MSSEKKKTAAAAENDTTPWLNARREWNLYTGNVMGQKTMWQVVAFLSMAIALAAVGGLVIVSYQSKYIPYVVAVDKLGETFAIQRADRMTPIDPRVLRVTLARFVSDSRGITSDPLVQQEMVWRVYSMLRQSTPAFTKMNVFRKDKELSPDTLQEKFTIAVQILNILQQSAATYEITWKEDAYNRESGQKVGERLMRGLFRYKVAPPDSTTTEQSLRRNPLGVFVTDYNWGEVSPDLQDQVEVTTEKEK